MKLQITSDTNRWRDLIAFQIQDLEAAKAAGWRLALLAEAAGQATALRILDSMDVPVLACIAPLGWNTPTAARGHTWVP